MKLQLLGFTRCEPNRHRRHFGGTASSLPSQKTNRRRRQRVPPDLKGSSKAARRTHSTGHQESVDLRSQFGHRQGRERRLYGDESTLLPVPLGQFLPVTNGGCAALCPIGFASWRHHQQAALAAHRKFKRPPSPTIGGSCVAPCVVSVDGEAPRPSTRKTAAPSAMRRGKPRRKRLVKRMGLRTRGRRSATGLSDRQRVQSAYMLGRCGDAGFVRCHCWRRVSVQPPHLEQHPGRSRRWCPPIRTSGHLCNPNQSGAFTAPS